MELNHHDRDGHSPPEHRQPQPAICIQHFKQKALARRWDVSTRTLERWRRTGIGPVFLKLNGRVIYRLQDIEAFEAARAQDSTTAKSDPAERHEGAGQ